MHKFSIHHKDAGPIAPLQHDVEVVVGYLRGKGAGVRFKRGKLQNNIGRKIQQFWNKDLIWGYSKQGLDMKQRVFKIGLMVYLVFPKYKLQLRI